MTLTDRVLEGMLYAGHGNQQDARRKAEPGWSYVHHELCWPGVTLMLLWVEYRQCEPNGYRHSRWCELYSAWESRLSPTMRQVHPARERTLVGYVGQTVNLIDGRTGGIRPVQIFIAVARPITASCGRFRPPGSLRPTPSRRFFGAPERVGRTSPGAASGFAS